MIKLTKENIDSAIVSKGNNIVNKLQKGYILTDETLCTFNSLMIFKELFNNKCKMLDAALENLYYIADRLISCDGGDEPGPVDTYYTVTVHSNKSNARYYINNIERSTATFVRGTSNIVVKATCEGYVDKTYTITTLTENRDIYLEFTNDDILPTEKYTVTVICNVNDATIEINNQIRSNAILDAGSTVNIRAYKEGYTTFTKTIYNLSKDEVVNAILEEEVITDVLLRVITTPSNANVTIYDKTNGRTYPDTKEKRFDKNTIVKVVVSLDGYTPVERDNILLSIDTTLNITLQAIEPIKYKIVVDTVPSGAEVSIRNIDTGTIHSNGSEFENGTRLSIVASNSGYYDKTLLYTVNSSDAVDGIITKTLTLTPIWNIVVNVWKDALGTEPLNDATITLKDVLLGQYLTPISHSGNTWEFTNCIEDREYKLTVNRQGYTQQNNTQFTVVTNNQVVDVYMQANNYNLKVIVVDADNNNTAIQSVDVTVNGNPVAYANGISESVSILGGSEVTIGASAAGYQSVNPVKIIMPFNSYIYLFYLSANTSTVNVTVQDDVTNNDITNNCTIKINGVTGNNQVISPGSINLEVSYNSQIPAYVSYVGTEVVTAGNNNILIKLVPYVKVTFIGIDEYGNNVDYMTFDEREQNNNIVIRRNNYTIDFYVPYEEDIAGDFLVEHYYFKTVEKLDIISDEIVTLVFTRKDVKVTLVGPSGAVYYMDNSNIIYGNEVWVRKGTYHSFTAVKQGYLSDTKSQTFNADTTLTFVLYVPIYIHVVDNHGNNITGLNDYNINLFNPGSPGTNIYYECQGYEESPGLYYVEVPADITGHTLVVSKTGYNTVTQNNITTTGEKHLYVTLEDSNVELEILVRNSANNTYINDATIYVDNVEIQDNPVSVSKGSHIIKVQKTGFGTVTETITITQDQTITIDIKPTVTAHIHAHKSDVVGSNAYNGVTVRYAPIPGNYTIVNNTDANITYELPYNTNLIVEATATGYTSAARTFNFTEETLEVYIDLELTPQTNVLTIYVIDAETQTEINDANVTFNIE